VHIDYSNRAESGAEAAYLRGWCQARGVALRVRTVVEISRGVTPRDEYERESRRIRFDAYREAMEEHGASAVFFGHHMGDVQENVVSNVMKGASVLDVAGAGLRAGVRGGRGGVGAA
jgi:tRNA(Ile)-lysidine synthase TilS/MesJ